MTIFQRRVDGAKRNPPVRIAADSGGNSSAFIHPTSSSTGGRIVTHAAGDMTCVFSRWQERTRVILTMGENPGGRAARGAAAANARPGGRDRSTGHGRKRFLKRLPAPV